MRYIFALTVAAGLIFSSSATSKEPDYDRRLALAEEMAEIAQSEQLSKQLIDGVIAAQKQALEVIFEKSKFTDQRRKEIIEKVAAIISEELDPAIREFTKKTAPLLAEVYTHEELEGILAFYNSPAGKAMLAKQAELMQKSLAIGQKWNAENLPAAMDRMQPRIQAIIEDASRAE